jgi:hypothetical protein
MSSGYVGTPSINRTTAGAGTGKIRVIVGG